MTDSSATVTVNATSVPSGSASAALPLAAGDNTIAVVVTAADGSTSTYTVAIENTAYWEVTVRDDVPQTGQPRRFMRLRITK